ncbi:MAG TPA: DnaJ domain-containing protein [Caulobacteraceae bacterium]|nr:DnaJ domain-containing protein [Caulobacteraceae bacterium]
MSGRALTPIQAQAVLGLTAAAGPAELRRAFREAAKLAHPDRPGGDAERFRLVIEAYELLRAAGHALPAPEAADEPLTITPLMAFEGGFRNVALADGRLIRITLPAGLRHGERLRAGEAVFTIAVAADGETLVRGDDLWVTARLSPVLLAEGGRAAVETPLGRRIVWITRKAAARGLIRLEGQGLPARAGHAQGSLFIRLAADEAPAEGPARQLLKRFAAAWAA